MADIKKNNVDSSVSIDIQDANSQYDTRSEIDWLIIAMNTEKERQELTNEINNKKILEEILRIFPSYEEYDEDELRKLNNEQLLTFKKIDIESLSEKDISKLLELFWEFDPNDDLDTQKIILETIHSSIQKIIEERWWELGLAIDSLIKTSDEFAGVMENIK